MRRTVKLAVYALHILAVCDHSMHTASTGGHHVHLVFQRFPPPTINILCCAVPIRYCISSYMEYINQFCIWSIATLCLVSPFITLFNAFITGSIKLQAYMLLCFPLFTSSPLQLIVQAMKGAILPVCWCTTL